MQAGVALELYVTHCQCAIVREESSTANCIVVILNVIRDCNCANGGVPQGSELVDSIEQSLCLTPTWQYKTSIMTGACV